MDKENKTSLKQQILDLEKKLDHLLYDKDFSAGSYTKLEDLKISIDDIKKYENIEAEIEKRNREFEIFFNSSVDLLCIAETNGRFFRLNQEWEEVLGYKLSELEGSSFFDYIHPEDIEPTQKAVKKLKKQKKVMSFTNRYRCKNGEYVWLEWKSFPSGNKIYAAARNVSERIKMEKALSHSRDLMRYVIEHNRSAVAVHDKEMKYIYVSQRYKDEYNVKDNNIIGKHHYDVFPDLPQKWRAVHKKALEGIVSKGEDDPYYKEDGSIEWTRWECRPWYEANGEIGGFIVYTEVITDRKRMELDLKEAKEKAEASDRLKTVFLNNMSHEVRTPLNAIVGFSKLMASNADSPEKLEKFSEIIELSSRKLIDIITNVVNISQIQSNQVQKYLSKFTMDQIIAAIKSHYAKTAKEKGIEFIIENNCNDENPTLVSDQKKVNKIVKHLVDNAIKFTKNGSVNVQFNCANENLKILVSDTGIGMDKNKCDLAFKPFMQVETNTGDLSEGNGLGLSIAKAYVDLLEGTIELITEKNKGTTITVNIPVKKTVADSAGHENMRSKEHRKTVVIAEDEYSNYQYLFELMNDKEIEILHAVNGQEAVDFCKNTTDIGLVFMDIKMPVMDGYQAAKIIRDLNPDIPIIAQTAYAMEKEIKKYSGIFNDYITKPIHPEILTNIIRQYLSVK